MTRKLKNNNQNWQFPIGMIAGVVVLIGLVHVIKTVAERDLAISFIDESPALLALIIALVSLFISYKMFIEQRLMRQAGTDPVVLVHLGTREDARILSTLEIENVGAGAAINVTVRLKTDVGDFFPDRIITNLSEIQPMRAIPQGRSKSFNFGVGHELLAQPPIPPINFEVSYENIDGERIINTQTINVIELTGQRADDSLMARATKGLEAIAKETAAIASPKVPREVVTETRAEHKNRRHNEQEEMRKLLKDQKGKN